MGMTELIFVDHRMKVNGQYYRDALMSQQMLPAIKHVAGETYQNYFLTLCYMWCCFRKLLMNLESRG